MKDLPEDERPLAGDGELGHLKCLFAAHSRADLKALVASPDVEHKVSYLRGKFRYILRMGLLRNKTWLSLKHNPPLGYTTKEWERKWPFPGIFSLNRAWTKIDLLERIGDMMALPKDKPLSPQQVSKLASTPKRARGEDPRWEDADEVATKRRRLSAMVEMASPDQLERMEQALTPNAKAG